MKNMAHSTLPKTPGVGVSSAYQKFVDLDIAVITERNDHGERLLREVQKSRARVVHIWPVPDELPAEFDIIFCDLVPDLPSRVRGVPGVPEAALIPVVSVKGVEDITVLEQCAPHAVVHLPATPASVLTSLVLARNNFTYERRLRQRIDKLDDTLQSMKTIERAKVLMMQAKNISEEEAYQRLRQSAMKRRTSIGKLAAAIVDSDNLIG